MRKYVYIQSHEQEVLRICAAMDEMMDESKEEGSTPGRTGGGSNGKSSAISAK